MSILQNLQQTMADVGPLVEDIELIQQLGDNRWLVIFDEESAIEIEFDEVANKLTFSAVLAAVEEGNETDIYQLLLRYNYLWRETGGIRMALDGTNDQVVMLFDLFQPEVAKATLATVIGNLQDAALMWRQAIENGNAAAAVDAVTGSGGGGMPDAIRV